MRKKGKLKNGKQYQGGRLKPVDRQEFVDVCNDYLKMKYNLKDAAAKLGWSWITFQKYLRIVLDKDEELPEGLFWDEYVDEE